MGESEAKPRLDTASLALLSAEAHGSKGVRLRYLDSGGEGTLREFDPFELAFRAGRWYAVGHCHLRKAIRSFPPNRAEAETAQERAFAQPADST